LQIKDRDKKYTGVGYSMDIRHLSGGGRFDNQFMSLLSENLKVRVLPFLALPLSKKRKRDRSTRFHRFAVLKRWSRGQNGWGSFPALPSDGPFGTE
jgi:hypothetical protein